MLLSLVGFSQPRKMIPFKPFEQCIRVDESELRKLTTEKQETVINLALDGAQGSFFTQKIESFSKNKIKKFPFSFNVIQGNGSPNRYVDVAALQANSINQGALFQVASNLDCLEADGGKRFLVTDYIRYNTQGEIAVLSATPGIIDRMYLQPDVRLLKDFNWNGPVPLSEGYFPFHPALRHQFKNMTQQDIFDAAATVSVGVQHDVMVTSGFRINNFGSLKAEIPRSYQKITQVLTAALDPYNNYNQIKTDGFKNFARVLLHAAYKGTFDVARKLGIKKVYLTLVGGGVFQNDYRWISEAITSACNDLAYHPEAEGMEVILIVYSKPNVDSSQWDTFSKDIQQLCKSHNGKWRTL